jgi:ribonuclease HI
MEHRALLLYTDGACRGNPGVGGAGAVLVDPKGRVVCSLKKFLGLCTNNIAEYKALILGLEAAVERRPKKLHIFLDSELLVKQVDGSYRVKHKNLKPLMGKVRGLLSSLESYTIQHIGRSENKKADELANEAIDEAFE